VRGLAKTDQRGRLALDLAGPLWKNRGPRWSTRLRHGLGVGRAPLPGLGTFHNTPRTRDPQYVESIPSLAQRLRGVRCHGAPATPSHGARRVEPSAARGPSQARKVKRKPGRGDAGFARPRTPKPFVSLAAQRGCSRAGVTAPPPKRKVVRSNPAAARRRSPPAGGVDTKRVEAFRRPRPTAGHCRRPRAQRAQLRAQYTHRGPAGPFRPGRPRAGGQRYERFTRPSGLFARRNVTYRPARQTVEYTPLKGKPAVPAFGCGISAIEEATGPFLRDYREPGRIGESSDGRARRSATSSTDTPSASESPTSSSLRRAVLTHRSGRSRRHPIASVVMLAGAKVRSARAGAAGRDRRVSAPSQERRVELSAPRAVAEGTLLRAAAR